MLPLGHSHSGVNDDGLGNDGTDGRDEDQLEDKKGDETGGDDGQEELFEAAENFAASAWLIKRLLSDGHGDVAVIVDSGHFYFLISFFLIIMIIPKILYIILNQGQNLFCGQRLNKEQHIKNLNSVN